MKHVKKMLLKLQQVQFPAEAGWGFESVCHMLFLSIRSNFPLRIATLGSLSKCDDFTFLINQPFEQCRFGKIENIDTLNFECYYRPLASNFKVIDAFILTKAVIGKFSPSEQPKVLLMQYTIRYDHPVDLENLKDIVTAISSKILADDVLWYFVFFFDSERSKFTGPQEEYSFDIPIAQQESQSEGENKTRQVKVKTCLAWLYTRLRFPDISEDANEEALVSSKRKRPLGTKNQNSVKKKQAS